MRPAYRVILCLSALGAISGPLALAHGGRTNASGCHHNRRSGDYHCHGGGADDAGSGGSYGGGNGGGYTAPAPPVCSDVVSIRVAVKLYRLTPSGREELWRASDRVQVTKIRASLTGMKGNLFTYNVQDVEVRNFVTTDRSMNQFSFSGSDWINVQTEEQQGDTTISRLESNPLEIASEHYSKIHTSRTVCH